LAEPDKSGCGFIAKDSHFNEIANNQSQHAFMNYTTKEQREQRMDIVTL